MAWQFELVAGPFGGRTDGPVWDGSGLIFASNGENAIRRYDLATREAMVFRAHWIRIRGLAFAPDGTLFGCQSGSRRIVRFNADGSASPVRALLDGQMHNCPDDLAIDRQSRIWFSDPLDPEPPRGPHIRPFLDHQSVLRLERADAPAEGWRLERMTPDTRCPRGLALSADERALYVADSDDDPGGVHQIRVYRIDDDGSLAAGRTLYRFGDEYSGVDGLRLDREGNVLACAAAARGPGAVCVIAPTGALVATSMIPEGQPTGCAFDDGERLYVTTAQGHLFART